VRWSERMVSRGYLSGAQAEADRARRDSARFTLAKAEEELRILQTYTRVREITDLQSKIEEARRALERVKQQAVAKEVQAATESVTKKSIYYQELDKYNDLEQQLSLCTIVAPQDGMVVYYIPEQSRFGSTNGPIIAQGSRCARDKSSCASPTCAA
jgi:HlyD family secretion protein